MKERKARSNGGIDGVVPICSLLTLILLICFPAGLLMAQSIADAAKSERERREQVKDHGKVFSDSDVKSSSERSNLNAAPGSSNASSPSIQGTVAIPMRRAGTAMIVSAELNKRFKGDLVVDTGSSFIGLSKAFAATLGLTTAKPARFIPLQTANGVRMAPIMKLNSLRLGGIEVSDIETSIIDDWADPEAVGILGMNFLGAFDWSTDNANNQLLLKRTKSADSH